MGSLLQAFTYPRNAFAHSPEESATKVMDVLARVRRGQLLTQEGRVKDEPFNDLRLFTRTVTGRPDAPAVTAIGERYQQLHRQSPRGAWRWLLTRSMWLYSCPNGSAAHINRRAQELGVHFNFFDMVTRLIVHLSALPQPNNILYFDELLQVLDDDSAWGLDSEVVHDRVMDVRRASALQGRPEDHASLLDELEPRYRLGRDYANTVYRKAFGQCGLFSMVTVSQRVVGMRLDMATYDNPVLAQRLRFVLDNPRLFAP